MVVGVDSRFADSFDLLPGAYDSINFFNSGIFVSLFYNEKRESSFCTWKIFLVQFTIH